MTWPFENDTSAITKKLAQRSFKANKLRNIVAVIAIVLTSMLFTSVTTLCVGAIQFNEELKALLGDQTTVVAQQMVQAALYGLLEKQVSEWQAEVVDEKPQFFS